MGLTNFVIDGEFITTHARDRLIEGYWREAERFLQTIDGLSHTQMVDILSGRSKMTGNSDDGLALEDDDATEEMSAQFERMWGGCVHYRDKYWKPYAVVVGWGPRDVGAGTRYDHPLYNYHSTAVPHGRMNQGRALTKWLQSRNVAYMNHKQDDLQHILDVPEHGEELSGTHCILWEECQMPPSWFDIAQGANWQLGLENYLKHHRLDVRDHSSWFSDDDWVEERTRIDRDARGLDDEDEEEETPVESKMSDVITDLATGIGLPADAAKGLGKFLSGDLTEAAPEAADMSVFKDIYHGWVLKDGRIFACDYHHHAVLAAAILKHEFGLADDDDEVADAEKAGEKRGWIRISKSALNGEYHCMIVGRPSAKQQATFGAWCLLHDLNEETILTEHFTGDS